MAALSILNIVLGFPLLKNEHVRRYASLLTGIVFFVIIVYVSGVEQLTILLRPDPFALIIVFTATALMILAFATRWWIVSTAMIGKHGSINDFFFYAVSSLAVSVFMPQTLGVVMVRSTMLNRLQGVRLTQAVSSVFYDKLFDLLIVIILAIPALLFIGDFIDADVAFGMSIAFVVVVLLLLMIFYKKALLLAMASLRIILTISGHIPLLGKIIEKKAPQLQKLPEQDFLQKSTVIKAYNQTLVGQTLQIAIVWAVGQAVDVHFDWTIALLMVTLMQVGILLAFTPNALGFTEVGAYAILANTDIDSDNVGVFLVGYRLFQAISYAVLWLSVYSYRMLKK